MTSLVDSTRFVIPKVRQVEYTNTLVSNPCVEIIEVGLNKCRDALITHQRAPRYTGALAKGIPSVATFNLDSLVSKALISGLRDIWILVTWIYTIG